MTVVLLQVLKDAEADTVIVTPRHLFSVILSLTKAGHSQHTGQVRWQHCHSLLRRLYHVIRQVNTVCSSQWQLVLSLLVMFLPCVWDRYIFIHQVSLLSCDARMVI